MADDQRESEGPHVLLPLEQEQDAPSKQWLTDYEIQKRMFVAAESPDDALDIWNRMRGRLDSVAAMAEVRMNLLKDGCTQT